MPLAGVEPVLGKPNSDLNAARLPIPPQWQQQGLFYTKPRLRFKSYFFLCNKLTAVPYP